MSGLRNFLDRIFGRANETGTPAPPEPGPAAFAPSTPLDARAWNSEAQRLAKLGQWEDAIACYEKALALDPQLIVAWNNEGANLSALGRREEAIACYEQALALDPHNAIAWNNKANNLADLGIQVRPQLSTTTVLCVNFGREKGCIKMFVVSDIMETTPDSYKSLVQEMAYESLARLQISFERVDTDEAISMEDCLQINQKLDMKMVKTLFLCNRQQTEFYLFVTAADKPFKSKDFSNALGISRVSFAPAELMENILGVKIGAATVFGVLMDKDNLVQVVFDKDVLLEEWYGCSDGTTTGYMKVKTKQIVDNFLTYAKHIPTVIEM